MNVKTRSIHTPLNLANKEIFKTMFSNFTLLCINRYTKNNLKSIPTLILAKFWPFRKYFFVLEKFQKVELFVAAANSSFDQPFSCNNSE